MATPGAAVAPPADPYLSHDNVRSTGGQGVLFGGGELSSAVSFELADEGNSRVNQRTNLDHPKVSRISTLITSSLPTSYQSNSKKELVALAHADSARRQFTSLFPGRKPLFLTPKNEAGIPKLVCSTVRATQLPYKELYTMEGAANFVSDYMRHEPLVAPTETPQYLVSPGQALEWQAGDSFDIANVLCSMLLGSGYDAYVVCGYVSKELALGDESFRRCPLLETEEVEEVEEENAPRVYTFPKRRTLESKYVKKLAKEKADAEAAAKAAEEQVLRDADLAYENELKRDELRGHRVHAWVMVLPGQRRVSEATMIEPCTAALLSPNHPGLLGVECVWNSQNVWANMQESSGPRLDLSLDLADPEAWEPLLATEDSDSAAADGGSAAYLNGGGLGATGTPPPFGDSNNPLHTHHNPTAQLLALPPAWSEVFSLTREQYELRWPGGSKVTVMRRSVMKEYGPYVRGDGMVAEALIFGDARRTQLLETRCVFSHRHDHLEQRSTFTEDSRVVEVFGRGRPHALKEHTYVPGVRREMIFHSEARLDALVRREIVEGERCTEWFAEGGRDSPLEVKSVYFDGSELARECGPGGPKSGEPSTSSNQPNATNGNSSSIRGYVTRISEQFRRSEATPATEDPFKQTYHLGGGALAGAGPGAGRVHRDRGDDGTYDTAKVSFHLETGSIVRWWREHARDPNSPPAVYPDDAFSEAVKGSKLRVERTRLFAALKNCISGYRETLREVNVILRSRDQENGDVRLLVDAFDSVRNAPSAGGRRQNSKEEEGEDVEVVRDYLTPYLMQLQLISTSSSDISSPLARDDAVRVKNTALRSLKDRLIDKANLIQSRLDDETAGLARRQAAFQRNQDNLSREEEEEYVRYCNDAMFRIHILEQRLARHEEHALHRYAALDSQLRADPRLAALNY